MSISSYDFLSIIQAKESADTAPGSGSFDYASKIEPGCEIVVPERGARTGPSAAEMMAIASSATSLTTLVATLVNLFK